MTPAQRLQLGLSEQPRPGAGPDEELAAIRHALRVLEERCVQGTDANDPLHGQMRERLRELRRWQGEIELRRLQRIQPPT